MTDGETNTTITSETGAEAEMKTEEPVRTFTQAEVDEIVSKRLKSEKDRREREDKERADKEEKARKIAALEGEERVKAEYEAKMQERDAELAKMKRDLAISRTEAKLSAQGLPIELAGNLIGDDDEKTDANIHALVKSVNDLVAEKVKGNLNHGTPPAGGQAPTKDKELSDKLDKLMKVRV